MKLELCPFCKSEPVKSKYSDLVICECLRASNTWIPIEVWQTRKASTAPMAPIQWPENDLIKDSDMSKPGKYIQTNSTGDSAK